MPGYGSIAEVPAAWLSAAALIASSWIRDRLLSPVHQLKQCRREIEASLVAAFSLRDEVVRFTGQPGIEALNALSDACGDLREEAQRLDALANRPPLLLRLYAGVRRYDLRQAAQGLRWLSESLTTSNGRLPQGQAL